MDTGAAAAAHSGIFDDFISIEHFNCNGIERYFKLFADDLAHHREDTGTGIGDRRRQSYRTFLVNLNPRVRLAALGNPVADSAAPAAIFSLGLGEPRRFDCASERLSR